CGIASAEKALVSKANLEKMSTHVVVGEVMGIYSKVEEKGNYRVTRYVAEVKIDAVEKGDGLKGRELVYVRYWSQQWIGKGLPDPGTTGHWPKPGEGVRVRVYLVDSGYDGFGTTADGGFTVFGGNGFELLKK
ncbi:MAG: hypothetical protein P8J87_08790, partial [Verrucomicrobiales bacterium]|nr:hypothetical protein [Verrucomicrobiales bacterium]